MVLMTIWSDNTRILKPFSYTYVSIYKITGITDNAFGYTCLSFSTKYIMSDLQ